MNGRQQAGMVLVASVVGVAVLQQVASSQGAVLGLSQVQVSVLILGAGLLLAQAAGRLPLA